MQRTVFALFFGLFIAAPAHAQREPVMLHAAGSLRLALTEVSQAFERANGLEVRQTYRASGLLRQAIAGGERAEVFASANMSHPLALHREGRSGPVVLFARNEMCAFVREGLDVSAETLLVRMLDPAIKLGTSTPRADPAGDYAFAIFARAEALRTGARVALEAKALQLTGGPNSPPPPTDRNVYGMLLAQGTADLFLAYCTNAAPIAREQPGQRVIRLPEALAVGADYGVTVVNGASANAYRFAMFLLAPEGQAILARHGFAAPTTPKEPLP
jgi:molybdate transport system substrate-binding protein